MPLSYVDKITGVSRKFDDNQNEFVISYKSNYDHIWDPILDIFSLSPYPLPEQVIDRLRGDPGQLVTGHNHDRGFGRVIVNPDDPSSNTGVVRANLMARKENQTIYDFENALLEPAGAASQHTVYFVPGGFVLQLTDSYLAGDPTGSAFLSANKLKDPVTSNQTPGLFQLRLPHDKTLKQTIDDFNAMSEVLYAEPMYCGFSDQRISPNEAYYPTDLWGVKKIQTVNAWNDIDSTPPNNRAGNPKVKIAVVDTGVKDKHQDIGSYTPGFTAWCLETKPLGTDWDFTDGGDDKPEDESSDGHGTSVIGVIGAQSPNSIGTVGVAPGCKIFPLRVDLGVTMGGTYADRADAINYAANRADNETGNRYIINLSWTMTTDASAVRTAIQNAVANCVVIASAGENSPNGIDIGPNPVYPASYPNVIAVGASNQSDNKISTSNFGSNNFVFAPGTSIYTTHNGSMSSYTTTGGTSMAAAFVSGVAGLIYTKNAALHANSFTINAASVRSILLANCQDPTGTLPGAGRVNALLSVQATP